MTRSKRRSKQSIQDNYFYYTYTANIDGERQHVWETIMMDGTDEVTVVFHDDAPSGDPPKIKCRHYSHFF